MIPFDIKFLKGKTQVSWIDASLEEFREPFFFDTIEKLKLDKRKEIITDSSELLKFSSISNKKIQGVIFHISRCGSTTLSNCINYATNCNVISEAGIIAKLVHPIVHNYKIDNNKSYEFYRNLLTGFIGAICNESVTPIIIKTTSLNLLGWKHLLSAIPNAKPVLMYRDPIEVLASIIKNPSGWLSICKRPDDAAYYFGRDFVDYDDLNTAAAALSIFLSKAKTLNDELNVFNIDYRNLNAENIIEAFNYLELVKNEDYVSQIADALNLYSKDSSKIKQFVSDSGEKQNYFSSTEINIIKKWTLYPYKSLSPE